jgi:hypothetical protein
VTLLLGAAAPARSLLLVLWQSCYSIEQGKASSLAARGGRIFQPGSAISPAWRAAALRGRAILSYAVVSTGVEKVMSAKRLREPIARPGTLWAPGAMPVVMPG